MVEIQAGIPYNVLVNSNNTKAVMVGCFHILHSLGQYSKRKPIQALIKKLQTQTWERAARTSENFEVSPMYSFLGLKPNDHFGKVKEGSFEGSYNLASTIMKRNSCGILHPALQISILEAKEQIYDILVTLHSLY